MTSAGSAVIADAAGCPTLGSLAKGGVQIETLEPRFPCQVTNPARPAPSFATGSPRTRYFTNLNVPFCQRQSFILESGDVCLHVASELCSLTFSGQWAVAGRELLCHQRSLQQVLYLHRFCNCQKCRPFTFKDIALSKGEGRSLGTRADLVWRGHSLRLRSGQALSAAAAAQAAFCFQSRGSPAFCQASSPPCSAHTWW
jgi:hypothetical protein